MGLLCGAGGGGGGGTAPHPSVYEVEVVPRLIAYAPTGEGGVSTTGMTSSQHAQIPFLVPHDPFMCLAVGRLRKHPKTMCKYAPERTIPPLAAIGLEAFVSRVSGEDRGSLVRPLFPSKTQKPPRLGVLYSMTTRMDYGFVDLCIVF